MLWRWNQKSSRLGERQRMFIFTNQLREKKSPKLLPVILKKHWVSNCEKLHSSTFSSCCISCVWLDIFMIKKAIFLTCICLWTGWALGQVQPASTIDHNRSVRSIRGARSVDPRSVRSIDPRCPPHDRSARSLRRCDRSVRSVRSCCVVGPLTLSC